MKGQKARVLTLAEKCKNILASNWKGNLNTIKADSQGSKQDIYASRVKYLIKKGKPYIWVPEKDLHNVNTVIDERASFGVASHFPGPLANLLRSMKQFPARVALTGEVMVLRDEKAHLAIESLRETVISEQKTLVESSYAVSGILNSSTFGSTSRCENLLEVFNSDENYVVYKLNISSCVFIDGNGGTHEVDLQELEISKADKLSPFSAKLIDGINQSAIRRRALMIFCLVYLNTYAKDAYILWVDRKGFDVLGKVASSGGEFHWKEIRFTFKEEACDVESFCHQLVEMEEEALKNVKSYSGLG
ncbi:hypothetical protein Nepgr_012542 [Nepenthes gracilis]|uniref:FMN-binding split barrel n=1 Tax=Nepenthes gracilis TaxID=150966 RepID=A0AAD3SH58_NEPGR|nr:hypothetical protein Nepgr_012542 [Nepenthes gracilis]